MRMHKSLIFLAVVAFTIVSLAAIAFGPPGMLPLGLAGATAGATAGILVGNPFGVGEKLNEVIFRQMVRQGLVAFMTTLAVNKPRAYELGDIQEYPVIATDI